jgi:hypothetical protein
MKLTLLNLGLGSPSGLPKFQSSIIGVKTPRIGVFFISLERYWSVDVENGLAWAIWTSAAQVMAKRKVKSQPLKVRNRHDPDVCRWIATYHWKAIEESYKFALDLIPIGGLSKELWSLKVPGVQTEIVLGLLLGSLGTKSHSNVGAAERHKVYYMGEGGGFPQIRAVVNKVNPELPVACLSTKGAPESELTNLLVSLIQVRVSEYLVTLPSPIP